MHQTEAYFYQYGEISGLGVSTAFLERDRWAGARIPFVKIGTRTVRYKPSELEAYIADQTRRSTSDTGVQS